MTETEKFLQKKVNELYKENNELKKQLNRESNKDFVIKNLAELEIEEEYDEEEYYEFLKKPPKYFRSKRYKELIKKAYEDRPENPLNNVERVDIKVATSDISGWLTDNVLLTKNINGKIDCDDFYWTRTEVTTDADKVKLKVLYKFNFNGKYSYWDTIIVIMLPESYKDLYYSNKTEHFVWEKTPENRKTWTPGVDECPYCGEDKFKDLEADIWADWQPKYCPNCGHQMRYEND